MSSSPSDNVAGHAADSAAAPAAGQPTGLKARLRADMATAMKAKDTTTLATLRMALTAVQNEEVAGKSARELSDSDVLAVLGKEAKKRRESAEAFTGADREDLASKERAEEAVLQRYLPTPLDDAELAEIAAQAVAQVAEQLGEQPGQRQMGQVMKIANSVVAGRADGGRVAAAVRAQLAG